MIERWLAELERELRVHGRRRRRIVDELAGHLREGAAAHGEAEAVRRMGGAAAVARSFTPRLADRAFEQRDRLSALTMLAAMAASLPLAIDLERLGRRAGSHAWLWFFAFLAPTALVALASCIAVLRRGGLGARLAWLLVAMVVATAVVVVLELPPAGAEFRQYQVASAAIDLGRTPCIGFCAVADQADVLYRCNRTPSCMATDHAAEIRINYSLGALALAGFYLWAVTGWTPRRRRSQRVLAW